MFYLGIICNINFLWIHVVELPINLFCSTLLEFWAAVQIRSTLETKHINFINLHASTLAHSFHVCTFPCTFARLPTDVLRGFRRKQSFGTAEVYALVAYG